MRQGDQIIGVWFSLIAFHKLLKRMSERAYWSGFFCFFVFCFFTLNTWIVLLCLENLALYCYYWNKVLCHLLELNISWPRILWVCPAQMHQPEEWFWVHGMKQESANMLSCGYALFQMYNLLYIWNKYIQGIPACYSSWGLSKSWTRLSNWTTTS